jgi:hypothetical protein
MYQPMVAATDPCKQRCNVCPASPLTKLVAHTPWVPPPPTACRSPQMASRRYLDIQQVANRIWLQHFQHKVGYRHRRCLSHSFDEANHLAPAGCVQWDAVNISAAATRHSTAMSLNTAYPALHLVCSYVCYLWLCCALQLNLRGKALETFEALSNLAEIMAAKIRTIQVGTHHRRVQAGARVGARQASRCSPARVQVINALCHLERGFAIFTSV